MLTWDHVRASIVVDKLKHFRIDNEMHIAASSTMHFSQIADDGDYVERGNLLWLINKNTHTRKDSINRQLMSV